MRAVGPALSQRRRRAACSRDRHGRVNVDQIADISLTLHREDLYSGSTPPPSAGEATFVITRHRAGPIARIQVAFQGQYGRFVDLQE